MLSTPPSLDPLVEPVEPVDSGPVEVLDVPAPDVVAASVCPSVPGAVVEVSSPVVVVAGSVAAGSPVEGPVAEPVGSPVEPPVEVPTGPLDEPSVPAVPALHAEIQFTQTTSAPSVTNFISRAR